MPKFKLGDNVIYRSTIDPNHPYQNKEGIITYISQVLTTTYTVYFPDIIRSGYAIEGDLVLTNPPVPSLNPSAMAQPGVGRLTYNSVSKITSEFINNLYSSTLEELSGRTVPVQRTKTCDCGGFKTYKSMEPENHSSWCSSRSK